MVAAATTVFLKDSSKPGLALLPQHLTSLPEISSLAASHFHVCPAGLVFQTADGQPINDVEGLTKESVVYILPSMGKSATGGKKRKPTPVPGPKPNLIVGNLHQLLPDPNGAMQKFTLEYDPIVKIYLFGRHFYQTGDPDIAEIILTDREHFSKLQSAVYEEIAEIGGRGLFTSSTDDPKWAKAHRLLMPAFSAGAMKQYIPDMGRLADDLVFKCFDKMEDGAVVPIMDWTTNVTFQTIGAVGFGYDFHLLEKPELKTHPFIDSMAFVLSETQIRILRTKYWKKLPISSNRKFKHHMNLLNSTVDDVIRERRQSGIKRKDFLQYMLDTKDETGEPLDDENIREQVITFLIAGHETTSNLLSWALYFLALNPDVEKKVLEEVVSVVGPDPHKVPDVAQVGALKYTLMVLKETLRLYPPVPGFAKQCIKDVILPGGYEIKKGEDIGIQCLALHHNPRIWGADVEQFNPDRWTPEETEKRSMYSWLPFSAGNRGCIGMQFALQEARIILAMLIRKFHFSYSGPPMHYDIRALTLRPNNLMLKLHRRTGDFVVPTTSLQTAATDASTPVAYTRRHRLSVALPRLTVLFGSNSGTAEDFAAQMASMGKLFGFAGCECLTLDEWVGNGEGWKGLVIVVTSTYNGSPPDNAMEFDKWISKDWAGTKPFEGTRFAVFGCGNKQWRSYQDFPKKVDAAFENLGGERFFPLSAGDADRDLDLDFSTFQSNFWAYLEDLYKLEGESKVGLGSNPASITQAHSLAEKTGTGITIVEVVDEEEAKSTKSGRAGVPVGNATVVGVKELCGGDGLKKVRHVELSVPGVEYITGDHFEVFPEMDAGLVERVGKVTGWDLDRPFKIAHGEDKFISPKSIAAVAMTTPTTLRNLLLYHADLTAIPTRQILKFIQDHTPDAAKKASLDDVLLPTDESMQKFSAWLEKAKWWHRHVADLLEQFEIRGEEALRGFLEVVGSVAGRRYSISSADKWRKDGVDLTVGVVQDVAPDGRIYPGAASGYIERLNVGDHVRAVVRPVQTGFTPPSDPSIPIIMICAGTGISPFRGFLQHRELVNRVSVAKGGVSTTHLFFGMRNKEVDYLYREEVEKWVASGVLDEVHLAVSRPNASADSSTTPTPSPRYVQHHLLLPETTSAIKSLLSRGAIVYVCGNARGMAKGVAEAFVEMLGGEDKLEELRTGKRYLEDVWG